MCWTWILNAHVHILYDKKDISPVPKISVFPSVRPFLLGYRRVANTIAWSAFKPVAAGLQSAAPPPPSAICPYPPAPNPVSRQLERMFAAAVTASFTSVSFIYRF